MVLYKRKQVTFVKPPDVPEDLNTEVYYIPATKEWFYSYEEYLARMDYYRRRKFVCEITGNSCLMFFEALESEEKEMRGVEKNFPEALREHILRFLQFNRITRLDQLVDKVYSVFKNDYFPGETIYIKGPINGASPNNQSTEGQSSTKQRGTIREKVQYGSSDSVMTKYLVVRLNDMQQAIVTKDRISRDRNHFTKWLIKTFVKLTMSRSHKVGAPWVVKDKYARKYRIPQEYPDDLKHFAFSTPTGETLYEEFDKTASPSPDLGDASKAPVAGKNSKKASQTSKNMKKKAALNNILDSNDPNMPSGTPSRFIPIAPQTSPSKKGAIGNSIEKGHKMADLRKRFPTHHLPEKLQKELEEEESGISDRGSPLNNLSNNLSNVSITSIQPTKKYIVDDLEINFDIQNPKPMPEKLKSPENSKYWNDHLLTKIKEEPESDNDHDSKSGEDAFNNLENEMTDTNLRPIRYQEMNHLKSNDLVSIQDSLQSWVFLNIYHSVLKLDTFTFDDFIYAMGWNFEQFKKIGRCELLDEIWCAILGAIVSNQIPNSEQEVKAKADDTVFGLLINLPPKKLLSCSNMTDSSESKDDKSDDNESEERGSDSENDEKTLRSEDEDSGNESDSDNEKEFKKKKVSKKTVKDVGEEENGMEIYDDSLKDTKPDDKYNTHEHNAYIVMNYRSTPWHDRLRKRNFKDGNWQCILLGVLSLVEYVPEYKPIIDQIYKILAPHNLSPTPASVLNQFYDALDINLKFQALNILVELLVGGTIVRNYIDECLETSTTLRRTRLDNIRDFKTALEAAQKINLVVHDMLISSSGKDNGESSNKRPRLNFQAFEMNKEERILAEKDLKFKEAWEQRKEQLVKINGYKKAKREIEKKLTELDCQRVKLLGKDRLFNRYWWFENNGLPTLHGGTNEDDDNEDDADKDKSDEADVEDDKEEVLDETYLMGKLWVQGPTKDDLRIHLKTSLEETNNYIKEYTNYQSRFDPYCEDKNKSQKKDQKQIKEANGSTKQDESGMNKNQLREMHFSQLPKTFKETVSKMYGLKFKSKEIFLVSHDSKSEELIIDHHGGLAKASLINSLTPIQRKVIEEYTDPLMNGSCWRYYDRPEQITTLIQWLNPWGKRESQLRKELINVKDAIISGMEARRKALWLDQFPDNELEIQKDLDEVNKKLDKLKSGDNNQSENEDETNVDNSIGSKRTLRRKVSPRKRQKLQSVADIIEYGDIEDMSKLHEELELKLQEKRKQRELSRVLEWVNSKAREEYDKSLYDGGDKFRSKISKRSTRR